MYTASNIRNPQWVNVAHTQIDVDVDFSHMPEETVRFTASPDDTTAHGREIFARAVAGDFGVIAEYIEPQ